MISRRSALNLLFGLALLAGLWACTSTTATTPPDSAAPDPGTQSGSPGSPTAAPTPASAAECRHSILDPAEPIHAVHITGNWGANREPYNTLPSAYFEYLRELNVNWVGISVALHYDDSMDSTVERVYSGVTIPTFSDAFLRKMIKSFRDHGICVYLTLAFEAHRAEEAAHPVIRMQLGEPTPVWNDGRIEAEFWPWALDHPDHERFVAEFWESYTEQAVHFGQIAEEEGVGLYSMGTETEGLFRTRPSEEWPNDFRDELGAMVSAVRAVYSGPLTYDMWNIVVTRPELGFGPGSAHLWEDLDLDVVGISAYFPLGDCTPTRALPVEDLEQRWESIFQDYLLPMQAINPGRPIVFTEFGYTDLTSSIVYANANYFTPYEPTDRDGNGLDDGEETQANIIRAFFNVMDRHPGVVKGAFNWEMWMATNAQWASELAPYRSNSFRGRLAEDVFRQYYGGTPRTTLPTPIPPSSDAWTILPADACVIYDDQFSIEDWNAWPWNSDVNTQSSDVVYSGDRAIEVTLYPGGNVGIFLDRGVDLSPFNQLVFYVASQESVLQQIGVSVSYSGQEMASPLDIADYVEGGRIEPGQWVQVAMPISELSPDGGSIDTITIMDMSGGKNSTFSIDLILLVE